MPGPYYVRHQELQSSARNVKAEKDLPRRDEAVERAAELRDRPAACFLVTGYRGVGKSTFIRQVVAEVLRLEGENGSPVVTIEVNGAIGGKDEDRPRLLLRKLQRNLYLALRDQDLLIRLPANLRWQLHLSYIQTHNKVEHKSTSSWQLAGSLERKGWLERKRLTALFFILLQAAPYLTQSADALKTGSGWLSQQAGSLLSLIKLPKVLIAQLGQALSVPYWVAATVVPFLLGIMEPRFSFGWDMKSQREVASLYDDEVSETSFIRLLEQLQAASVAPRSFWRRLGYRLHSFCARTLARFNVRMPEAPRPRLIFIVDELDKLEAPDEDGEGKGLDKFDALVHGLKPVVLCGYAHFLMVSGMEHYYRWYSAAREEDNRFTNLFTAHFHVPSMGDGPLMEIFRMLLEQPSQAEELQDFCNCLIFRSRGRPRQFLAEFAHYVRWYPKPQLIFSEKQQADIVVEAKVQRALSEVWRLVGQWRLAPGIEDMLRTWAVLWIKRMLDLAGDAFGPDSLIRESEFQRPHEQDVADEAHQILSSLLAAMCRQQLLREEGQGTYKWVQEEDADSLARSTAFEPDPTELPRAHAVPDLVASLVRGFGDPVPDTLGAALDRLRDRGLLNNHADAVFDLEGRIHILPRAKLLTYLERYVERTLSQAGWRRATRQTPSQTDPGLDYVVRDPKDHLVLIAMKIAIGTRSLRNLIMDALQLLLRSSRLYLDEVKVTDGRAVILLVDLTGKPLSTHALLGMRLVSGLPFPVDVCITTSLKSDKLIAALGAPVLSIPPFGAKSAMKATPGDEFVHLEWDLTVTIPYRLYRATRSGDAEHVAGFTPETPPFFTDLNVTNDVSYVYKLIADDDHGRVLSMCLASPSAEAAPKDHRYWRALMSQAATIPLAPGEALEMPGHLNDIRNLVQTLASGTKKVGSDQLLGAARALQLLRTAEDGTPFLTSQGEAVARELKDSGRSNTLIRELIFHPAVRLLLRRLLKDGKLSLKIGTFRGLFLGRLGPAYEWLRFIGAETGTLQVTDDLIRWVHVRANPETEVAATVEQDLR